MPSAWVGATDMLHLEQDKPVKTKCYLLGALTEANIRVVST